MTPEDPLWLVVTEYTVLYWFCMDISVDIKPVGLSRQAPSVRTNCCTILRGSIVAASGAHQNVL